MSFRLTAALAFAVSPVSTAAVHGATPQDELVFVDGRRLENVREVGGEWSFARGGFAGSGTSAALMAAAEIGEGDFTIEAQVSFEKVARSGAAFELAGGRLGFAAPRPSSAVFVSGRGLNVKRNDPYLLPDTDRFFRDRKRYALEVRRRGRVVSFLVNGDELYSVSMGAQALGSFGFHPEEATLRIHAWRASGNLGRLPTSDSAALAELAPAVNAAVERGVEHLLARQLRDGSWAAYEASYRSGQSALCVYALLKSGVPAGHPAIQRALVFLECHPPHETYTVACHLLALQATGDPAHRERMQELTEALLDWQDRGVWGYPYKQDRGGGGLQDLSRPDLSNTQFAALGLRAAARAGVEIPARAWEQLLRGTLRFQEAPSRVQVTRSEGRSGSGEARAAGFCYRIDEPAEITGSMTAAGVSIVAICLEGLGAKRKDTLAKDAERSIDMGVQWLASHFTVGENPGKANHWLYYLYGLERVGSLLDVDRIGEHLWYLAGARRLLQLQSASGAWMVDSVEPETCFALLFLKRATARAASSGRRADVAGRYASPGTGEQLFLRGSGEPEVALWVAGFAADVGEELRVARVEYLVDDEVIATVVGDPDRAWGGERFATRHRFERVGTYRVAARATLVGDGEPSVVTSAGFAVDVTTVLEPWMLDAARMWQRNLLLDEHVEVTASSRWGEDFGARRLVDGLEHTAWLAKKDDRSPTVVLEPEHPVRADAIVLTQGISRRNEWGQQDRITRLSLRVNNDGERRIVEVDPDDFGPIVVRLEKPLVVGRIEVCVLDRFPGSRLPGAVGFAEVGLTLGE